MSPTEIKTDIKDLIVVLHNGMYYILEKTETKRHKLGYRFTFTNLTLYNNMRFNDSIEFIVPKEVNISTKVRLYNPDAICKISDLSEDIINRIINVIV